MTSDSVVNSRISISRPKKKCICNVFTQLPRFTPTARNTPLLLAVTNVSKQGTQENTKAEIQLELADDQASLRTEKTAPPIMRSSIVLAFGVSCGKEIGG